MLGLLLGLTLHMAGQCPHIVFIYADACDAPDGKGEFLLLDTGLEAVPVGDLTLTLPGGGQVCMSCKTRWDKPDVTNLNAITGCGTLFQALAPDDTVPPGGRLLVFTNRQFKDDVDWSSFCADAPVYVITIDKVDNTDKYAHNNTTCPQPTATTGLNFGASVPCPPHSVAYDPCSLPVESPSGSGGGYSVVFADDGSAIYRDVGCDNFLSRPSCSTVPQQIYDPASRPIW
ncbi:MAG: hypothetical protein OHK0039_15220 [Bacteroidia bacterium]